MRVAWPVGLLAVGALAACASRGSNARQAPGTGMYQGQPQQAAALPPAPPTQYSYAQGAQPVPGFNPLFLPPPVVPPPQFALGIARPVNTRALVAQSAASPCLKEVLPGKFVALDCLPQTPVRGARRFVAPRGFQANTLPLMVDHRVDGLEGPIKDQQSLGACTAFSLSSAMDSALRRIGRQGVVSPLHVWARYGTPNIGSAGDSNLDKAVADESVWPFDPVKGCRFSKRQGDSCETAYGVRADSVDAPLRKELQRAESSGSVTLSQVEELQSNPGNPDEMAGIVAGGDSVWVAFKSHDNWSSWNMGPDAVVQDYAQAEETGHAVVISGYRTLNGVRQFLIHNSWGPRWGDQGYGWISENMVRRHLLYAFRVQVRGQPASPAPAPAPPAAPGPAPTPAPAPAPAPASNGCPAAQVRDLVYGNCVAVCPSGSPPSAGFCLPVFPGFPWPTFPAPGAAPAQPNQPAPAPSPAPQSPPAQPAPQPSAPPAQQQQCPAGQTLDLFTRQCSAFCPNGLPPIGGLCLPVRMQ